MESGTVSNNLEEKLVTLIVDRLESGEKLPTEKQMVKDFGVSRTALREVLSIFEASGIVTTRQGSGRYVKMPDVGAQIVDAWSIMLRAKPSMLLELLEIRSILEINSLEQAMQRANMAQLQLLNNQVVIMKEKAEKNEDFVREDREFHRILFCSTGNILLEQLLTAFWDLYETSKIETRHSNLREVAWQHEKMLEAFTRQDLITLSQLMKEQFIDARFRIMVSLMNNEPKSLKND